MEYVIVTVYDKATDAFGRPIFTTAAGQAIRSFQDEINRVAPENDMNRHPEDFDLFELGKWDDQSGKFTQHDTPKQIAIGKQLKLNA